VVMVALGEEVAIQFAHPLLTKGPRVVLLMHDAGPSHPQPITAAGICWHLGLKDPGVMGGLGGPCRRLTLQQQFYGFRIWHPAAQNPTAVTELLGSQDGRRMVVTTVRQTLRVLSHPFKAGYGHGGWVNRARGELRLSAAPSAGGGQGRIGGEINADDGVAAVENDKNIVIESGEFRQHQH